MARTPPQAAFRSLLSARETHERLFEYYVSFNSNGWKGNRLWQQRTLENLKANTHRIPSQLGFSSDRKTSPNFEIIAM
jgi:hypothetical protein